MNTMTHALQSEWIDAAQFEVLYSLSRRTFWLWISEGKLTAYKPCKRKTLVIGQKDLDRITREEVKQPAYDLLAQQKARSTVKNVLAPIREMFNHAIEDGHATFNPALRILKQSRTEDGEQQRKADFLTREELGLLLRTCQEHFPTFYPLVSLLARTGVRLGEAVALQWGDLDFAGRFIEVRHTFGYGKLTTPKSGKGRRVDMSRQLTETLKAVLWERKKETLKHGWGEVPEWVFVSEEGTPPDACNFRNRIWYKLLLDMAEVLD